MERLRVMEKSKNGEVRFFIVGDTFILCLSLLFSIYYNIGNLSLQSSLALFAGLACLWFLIVYWQKLYMQSWYRDYETRLLNFLKTCLIFVALLGVIYLIFTFPPNVRNAIIAFSVGFPVAGIFTNFIIIRILYRWNNPSNTIRQALVVGTGNSAFNVSSYYKAHPKSGYQIEGFVKYEEEICKVNHARIFEDIQHVKDYLEDHHVDEILLTLPFENSKKVSELLEVADYHGTRVKIVPEYQSLLGNGNLSSAYKPRPVNVRSLPLDSKWARFVKESFDLLFSSVMLILLLPIFLVIMILIKLDSPRPVFYCPTRIGKNGKPFKVYKFSTMRESDPVDGGKNSTIKDDPRITSLGKILRKYSLDELPQFINVFLGDMSVVGPRPHRSYLNGELQKSEENYMIRHYYRPGITGWAQVNGWRGPTDTTEQKHQRTVHDLWYLENWSFGLDIKIIFMTIFGKKTHKSAF